MGKKELRLGANIMCFVIGIAILTTGTPVCAENLAEYTLDDVVVTATTTPVDQMKANASVTVITRQEIQANHYNTLQDALLHVPGYHGIVAANGVGYEVSGYTRPAIRGSNGVVVLIDGIEQKTDDRFYSTALTRNMDDVERIEILKGSSSVLYGSNAVGGVINIITRQRYDKPVSKLTVTGGSYHTQQYQLDTAGGDRSQFWSFSGMYRKQGDYTDGRGRRRPQDVDLKSMDLKYGMKLSDTTNLIFKYTRHNQHQTYCEGFGNNIDTDAHGILSLTSMSAILDYRAADGKSGNMLGFYRSTVHSDRREDGLPTKNLAKYPSGFYTWKEAFDARTWSITDRYYNQISPDHRLSAGFLIEDNAENIGIRSEAAYLQDEWAIGKRTVVTGGRALFAFAPMARNVAVWFQHRP